MSSEGNGPGEGSSSPRNEEEANFTVRFVSDKYIVPEIWDILKEIPRAKDAFEAINSVLNDMCKYMCDPTGNKHLCDAVLGSPTIFPIICQNPRYEDFVEEFFRIIKKDAQIDQATEAMVDLARTNMLLNRVNGIVSYGPRRYAVSDTIMLLGYIRGAIVSNLTTVAQKNMRLMTSSYNTECCITETLDKLEIVLKERGKRGDIGWA